MKTLKQFQEATGYLKVKSPDEQKFVDKHSVETIADKNGNGDEVFKASTTKKIERKKHRKGYEPSEDESVYEEIEDLDELSKSTFGSYVKKATNQAFNKLTKEEADYLIGRYADFKESIDQLAPRLQEAMYFVFDRLNEENQDVFMTSCETHGGLEQMVAFAIENRGN